MREDYAILSGRVVLRRYRLTGLLFWPEQRHIDVTVTARSRQDARQQFEATLTKPRRKKHYAVEWEHGPTITTLGPLTHDAILRAAGAAELPLAF